MCPILDGYGVTGIFQLSYTPWCEPCRSQLAGDLGGLSVDVMHERHPITLNYNNVPHAGARGSDMVDFQGTDR
jgi:hypothetical protein